MTWHNIVGVIYQLGKKIRTLKAIEAMKESIDNKIEQITEAYKNSLSDTASVLNDLKIAREENDKLKALFDQLIDERNELREELEERTNLLSECIEWICGTSQETGHWENGLKVTQKLLAEIDRLREGNNYDHETIVELREKLAVAEITIDDLRTKVDEKLRSIMAGNYSFLVESYSSQIASVFDQALAKTRGEK